MTDKELRALSRAELLEMLIAVSKENMELKAQVEELNYRLNDRNIAIEKSGSIAEAALTLNGVFEAAQAAASQYIENIRKKEAAMDAVQDEAEKKASKLISEAQIRAARIEAQAKQEAELYWQSVSTRLDNFWSEYAELKNLLKVDPREKL